jgi:hypothetical protein
MNSILPSLAGYYGFACGGSTVDKYIGKPLIIRSYQRFYDRYASASLSHRWAPFTAHPKADFAVIAASVGWHHTAPVFRDAEYAEVLKTASLLAAELGTSAPRPATVRRAVADPELFWRRLPESSSLLAQMLLESMYPQAQQVGHIYTADYTHLGWSIMADGAPAELLLLLIEDLYSRYIVAWGTFVRRPRADDFLLFLAALADAGLLPAILRSDREGCFSASVIPPFLEQHRCQSLLTPAGVPQFNGALERLNRFKETLPASAPHDREACEQILSAHIAAYHARVSHATKCAPSVLVSHVIRNPIVIHV